MSERAVPEPDYLSAAEAIRALEVRPATLYAYVSRGLIRSLPGPRGRARRYLRADIEQLIARRDARRGHAAVAAAALRWGEPVLDSAITEITADGPRYRGHSAVGLARAPASGGASSFEAVAELLWTGTLPAAAPRWPAPPVLPARSLAALLPADAGPLARATSITALLGARDRDRLAAPGTDEADLPRARRLIAAVASAIGPARAPRGERRIAAALACSLGARRRADGTAAPRVVDAIDRALVLLADHELNVSAFAARVAASSGADLYASTVAALGALSGPRHGGACDRVEALLAECRRPGDAARVVRERGQRGEALPGFGHPLYPDGDPRATPLLEQARILAPRRRTVRLALALQEAVATRGGEPPTVDLGLVALAAAVGLPPGSATAVFAVGRMAGWVAHAREQASAGYLLRPRARYRTGEAADTGR